IFDRHVAALDEAGLAQAFAECSDIGSPPGWCFTVEKPNYRHRRLLRVRCQRPCGRATECGQQFPPSDGDCHTPPPCEVRKSNDTTPRACCPNSAAPGRGALRTQAATERRPAPTCY